jgi:peptidyl-prolyl cis-trans isomerase SurA
MKYINSAIILVAILTFTGTTLFAQESEIRVVDEVVAQVNDSVVTLSQINREINAIIESGVQEGKTREAATEEVNKKRGELIATIINEELLIQKAKEFDADSQVEAQVNQNFIGKMKELNLKSLDELYAAMRQQGVEPDEIRAVWRKQFTRDFILQREVDSAVYNRWRAKELKTYFDANKTKFTKPEMVEISEIFLTFAGKNPASVREKAKELIAKLRAGEDFPALAIENSDRPDVKESKGKVENALAVKDLDPKFSAVLKDLKVGGISDPVEIPDNGIEIFRLEKRTNASEEAYFDEGAVRRTMTYEVLPDERRKYLVKLRDESYIKINDRYRPEVAPLLYAEERKAEADKTPTK